MKFKRQAAIVELIGKQEIKTQEELSEKLKEQLIGINEIIVT